MPNVARENAEKVIAAVGRRIAELRRQAELSQDRLSERLEVSVQYLSRVESGTNLTLETLVRIANALKVPLAELFVAPSPDSKIQRGRPRKAR